MAKILIVDDDSVMCRMYQTKFTLDGNEVILAHDGMEVLGKAITDKPDLILLDIMMPKKNGLEALSELKNNENTKNIPVIMLTNLGGSDADTMKGLELGAVAYLIKSNFTPKEVVQKVKEILSGYKREIPKVKTVIS